MSSLAEMDDHALAQQVQRDLQGQTAFAELYRRHVNHVYRYFLARVRNEQDAQDLTAQTFLTALESIPHFRSESKFSTWLFGIAHHKGVDFFRRKRPLVGLETAENLSDPDPPPDETVSQRLQVETVLNAMQVLSSERAEALALHSFGSLSVAEVAQVMHKSEAAVRMLIHRAIQDLQQRLAYRSVDNGTA
ncbi:MAG: RNA polymerase sigma factor [Anaerolineae bacterium]|nr:MAG: RNA polymerase sigma factor [Anaerolineae bacterium]MCL4877451.1 RNA polymerase sigma factor [Anaerolineae bacterium]